MKATAVLLLMLLLAAPPTPATQAPPGSVEGVVVDVLTGAPIAKVTLDLQSPDNPSIRYPGITSPEGRFAFAGVLPGRYSLTAMRTGYVRSQYGQRGPNGDPSILVVSPGQRVTNAQLSMVRCDFRPACRYGWRACGRGTSSRVEGDLSRRMARAGAHRFTGIQRPRRVSIVWTATGPVLHQRTTRAAGLHPGAVICGAGADYARRRSHEFQRGPGRSRAWRSGDTTPASNQRLVASLLPWNHRSIRCVSDSPSGGQ